MTRGPLVFWNIPEDQWVVIMGCAGAGVVLFAAVLALCFTFCSCRQVEDADEPVKIAIKMARNERPALALEINDPVKSDDNREYKL